MFKIRTCNREFTKKLSLVNVWVGSCCKFEFTENTEFKIYHMTVDFVLFWMTCSYVCMILIINSKMICKHIKNIVLFNQNLSRPACHYLLTNIINTCNSLSLSLSFPRIFFSFIFCDWIPEVNVLQASNVVVASRACLLSWNYRSQIRSRGHWRKTMQIVKFSIWKKMWNECRFH